MIANGSRQSYEERADSNGYRVRMVLTIQHFRHTDAGRYECRCENAHGKAEGAVKLHGESSLFQQIEPNEEILLRETFLLILFFCC